MTADHRSTEGGGRGWHRGGAIREVSQRTLQLG